MSARRLLAVLLLLPASLLFKSIPSLHRSPGLPTPVVPGGVQVTPDAGGPLYPEANTSGQFAGFYVKNTRTVTTTYTLSCSGTGGISGCTPDQTSVTLSPQQQTDVAVTFATGNPATAIVVLRATGAAADTGYYNLTITGPGFPGVSLEESE